MSGGSVLVQRLGDLRRGRRSDDKRIAASTTRPTLKAVPGDLSLCMPKRQLDNIIDGPDIVRRQIHFLQLVAVEGYVVINILHNLVKAFTLERAHLVATHAFFVGVPNHICRSFYVRG